MNKYKIKKKAGSIKLLVKSKKGQQLSEREVYAINRNEVPGLIHIDVSGRPGHFTLQYDFTGLLPFSEYLKVPLTKKAFTQMLRNIFESIQIMQETYFDTKCLVLDMKHVMVNPVTQQICFVYIPIPFQEDEDRVREFFSEIIRYASFVKDENVEYIKEYIELVNKGIHFSLYELGEYIERLGKEIER